MEVATRGISGAPHDHFHGSGNAIHDAPDLFLEGGDKFAECAETRSKQTSLDTQTDRHRRHPGKAKPYPGS
jgi:hypothetical protein